MTIPQTLLEARKPGFPQIFSWIIWMLNKAEEQAPLNPILFSPFSVFCSIELPGCSAFQHFVFHQGSLSIHFFDLPLK